MTKPILWRHFDAAVREMQISTPTEDDDTNEPVLPIYPLSRSDWQRLSDHLLQVAEHLAHLDALDDVAHHLDGFDVYGETPKIPMASPAAVADAVMREHADKYCDELVAIALEHYELDPAYRGKTDRRSVYRALYSNFKRRGAPVRVHERD